MAERKTHWLRENAAARMPRRLVVFDTESLQERSPKGAIHSFRCGAGTFDLLNYEAEPTREPRRAEWTDPLEMWSAITEITSVSHRTVAFAHNISFDIRISGALEYLPQLGFECRDIALNSYGFWAHYADGKRTLMLVDSLSFIPAPLERIAGLLRTTKPPLPEDDAPLEAWLARCRADVEVTREAVLRVLAFLRTEDCGDFRATGAAQSSAAFRHRFLRPRTLLVHDDSRALEAERRASWTGRAEVWRHGEVNERIYEYDFEYAYARIAQTAELPVRLIAEHGGIPYRRLERVMDHYAVLADVEVTTDVECVPCDSGEHIVWPVGTFATTLWDSELRLAHGNGAEIKVLRYWYYRRAPLLKEWADWILELLRRDARGLDPIVRLMLKDWSRALIGRFGLRYSATEQIADLQTSDVRMFGCYDVDEQRELTYVQLGRSLHEKMEKVESPNSTPAVMSAVMSLARVRLWEAMNVAGFQHLYYVDTDGILVDAAASRRLNRAIGTGGLPGLRRKAVYGYGHFRAPRNIDIEEIRRVSGAPKRAERLTPGVYRGEVWESLPAALRRHRGQTVHTREQLFHISEHDPRREHLEDGSTAPRRFTVEGCENIALSA